MRKILFFALLIIHSASFAQTPMPTQLGGFALNADVKQYEGKLKMETTLPIRFMEALKEVEIEQQPGFKSGYLAYGSCAAPGKVIRIKLKYKNSSKDFYKKLLKAYEEKLGKPKWLGDPFHVVSTWKWSFEDKNTQVDLYLQHNLSDKEEKFGNAAKMTMRNLIKDELDCFNAKNPNFRKQSNLEAIDHDDVKWDDLIPK